MNKNSKTKKYDKTQTLFVTYFNDSNCDKTQNLKLWTEKKIMKNITKKTPML